MVWLTVLAAEVELVAPVVARRVALAAADRAPCRRRDRLVVARTALATKISGAVPAAEAAVAALAIAAAEAVVAVPAAVALAAAVAVAAPLTQVV